MLAHCAALFHGTRALNNPSFASYFRHLGWENAQRAGVSQKGPQGRGRVSFLNSSQPSPIKHPKWQHINMINICQAFGHQILTPALQGIKTFALLLEQIEIQRHHYMKQPYDHFRSAHMRGLAALTCCKN